MVDGEWLYRGALVVTYFISACVTAAYVFCRALQQLQVVHGKYWRILPVSLLMGVGDVSLVLIMVKMDSLWIGVTNGIGGALGCLGAMWLHKRIG